MTVLVDTGFLSSLVKIERVGLITEFFDSDEFIVPTQVIQELKQSDVYDRLSAALTVTEDWSIRTETINYAQLDYSRERFGKGEIACIELSGDDDVILIDDRDAKKLAKRRGKRCYDLPTFLFACKKKGILDSETMGQIIDDLKTEDYYRFADDVEERLRS